MDVSAKLQIKPGQQVATVTGAAHVPPVAPEGAETTDAVGTADVIVAFVLTRAELGAIAAPAIEAARSGKLSWIAYPKAGKLGTDLNRDVLARSVAGQGIRPVRQVAIDDVWSALRFRPA